MLGKLLLHRSDNELLHFLVSLGDEVYRGTFAHDLHVILQGLPDNLYLKRGKRHDT